MRIYIAAIGVAGLAMAAPALAQSTTTTTVTTEQSAAGNVIVVPDDVRTYVTKQQTRSVVLEGPVVVGQALPDTVEYQIIPDNDGYAYAIVNDRRVIIDPQTRSVIEVYD
ncbi:MAG: DUF1236 domain-containing protein [Rhizobiaceae bacterium]|nr:DUF1236 domain-containing protein [Rhizobiaceae bacterium]